MEMIWNKLWFVVSLTATTKLVVAVLALGYDRGRIATEVVLWWCLSKHIL
jgi:hypothetical protein